MDDPFIRALSSAIWICNGFARRLDTLWIRYGVCYREGWRDILSGRGKGENDTVFMETYYYRNIVC